MIKIPREPISPLSIDLSAQMLDAPENKNEMVERIMKLMHQRKFRQKCKLDQWI